MPRGISGQGRVTLQTGIARSVSAFGGSLELLPPTFRSHAGPLGALLFARVDGRTTTALTDDN
ncbi:MAG TPA: hypothetical protein VK813_11340 [Edaphobacter sp.]|nr:hypothetical protein [Edaphobacter sp.]